MKPDNEFDSAFANPQGFNLYSYVHGNPVNFNDPTGHRRFQLSRSSEEIRAELARKIAEWEIAVGPKGDATLAEALATEIGMLQTELAVTLRIEAYLASLKKASTTKLELKDFTVTTDPGGDDLKGQNISKEDMANIMKYQAFTITPKDGKAGTIYLNTTVKGDWLTSPLGITEEQKAWGGSALAHEEVHLRGDRDEYNAYTKQRKVFDKLVDILKLSTIPRSFADTMKGVLSTRQEEERLKTAR
jgi:hypothetical protein